MKLQGLGGARFGPIAGAAHEPLRRQHLLRAADALERRRAHPRRGHRDPHPRARPLARQAHPHPAHPPASRPHPGADVLPALLPRRLRDHDLGPVVARGFAREPHRALHLGSAVAGRGPRAAVLGCLPRHAGQRMGARGSDDPRRGDHAPRPDARLPHHRRRHDARLSARPRAGAGLTARAGSTRRGSRASTSPTAPISSSTTASTPTPSTQPTSAGATRR